MKITANVLITFEYNPDDPKELLKDPEEFLAAMLSTMDPVSRHNVDWEIVTVAQAEPRNFTVF